MNFDYWYRRLKDIIPNDDKIHRNVVPALHGVLWFVGLLFVKYGASVLHIGPERQTILNLLGIVPTFLIFFFEIVITFIDFGVAYRVGNYLKVDFMHRIAFFVSILGITAFLVFFYSITTNDIVFILIILFSVLLKNMEYKLLNNIDQFIIERPAGLEAKGKYKVTEFK